MREKLSAYYEERQTPVDMLVFHCSAFEGEKLLQVLDEYHCSCHYMIDENGEIVRVVDEGKVAYHAGKSWWRGQENLNRNSIGIEICHPLLGQSPYLEKQIEKVTSLAQNIIQKYQISPKNVVGHSDIAPERKADPGKDFPWERLACQGIGLWYSPEEAKHVKENDVALLLSEIGYNVSRLELVKVAAYAFCRHFAPQFVAVEPDISALIENVGAKDFSFMEKDEFLQILKAVAFAYR